MLKVASFKIEDADGINALLEKYSLASGMHILMSEGKLCIPYEDGERKSNAVQIIEIKEEQNTLLAQKALIEHSEQVNAGQIADAENRVNVARADVEAETANQPKKEKQAKLEEAEQALAQILSQSRTNQYEIARIDRNIELFDEKIAKLSK